MSRVICVVDGVEYSGDDIRHLRQLIADCEPYMKEDETPAQCIERNRLDALRMTQKWQERGERRLRAECDAARDSAEYNARRAEKAEEEVAILRQRVAELEATVGGYRESFDALSRKYDELGKRMKEMRNWIISSFEEGLGAFPDWFDQDTGEPL